MEAHSLSREADRPQFEKVKDDSRTPRGARRPGWTVIYTGGAPFLWKTLRWLGVAERDLEDVFQDVLLAALTAWERYDASRYTRASPLEDAEDDQELIEARATLARLRPRLAAGPLVNWLFGIAWRQVSHYRERAHRRREVLVGLHVPPPPDAVDLQPSPEQELADAQRSELIARALAGLELDRRVVLILHDMLETGVPAVATELEVNPNTAQNRLRLARENFQTEVRCMGEERRRALQLDERSPLPGTRRAPRAPPRKPQGRSRK